jgi:hypothetical protein
VDQVGEKVRHERRLDFSGGQNGKSLVDESFQPDYKSLPPGRRCGRFDPGNPLSGKRSDVDLVERVRILSETA